MLGRDRIVIGMSRVEETDPLAGRPVGKELTKQTVDSRADFKVGHAGLGR